MTVQSFLDEHDVHYRLCRHSNVYTAQELAATEHVPGRQVIKTVVVRADGRFVLCALPASYRVDLSELKSQLLANEVTLADERTMVELFRDCQPGALAPIGRIYGLTTLMDESLLTPCGHVTFQAGTHEDAVTMTLADYRRVAQPELAHFGRPVQ